MRFVEGPFDMLTSEMCHDIFRAIVDKKILKKHHIYLLVNPVRFYLFFTLSLEILHTSFLHKNFQYLKSLDVSGILDTSKLGLVIELAEIRCQQLKRIVCNSFKMNLKVFHPCIDLMNRIVELDLGNSGVTNKDLSLIGGNAPLLKILNLRNTQVNEKGLRCLFFPMDLDGKHNSSYGQCKSIEYLNVQGVYCDDDTIVQIYMAIGNTLKLIRMDGAYELMLSTEFDVLKTDVIEIEGATCEDISSWIDNRSYEKTPFVRELFIVNQDRENFCFDENSTPFCFLPKLNDLWLVRFENFEPQFTTMGHQLTNLTISNCTIDVYWVMKSCPNLQILALIDNIYNESSKEILHDEYPLKEFSSESTSPGEWPMPRSLFKIFSYAKKLESIAFSDETELDDEILTEIFHSNPLHCLKKLSISYNENITMEILEGGILKNENVPLEKVILSKCENITKSDIQRYEKYLKSKNYNVEVNWD